MAAHPPRDADADGHWPQRWLIRRSISIRIRSTPPSSPDRNPLSRGVILADEVGLNKPSKQAWSSRNAGRSDGARILIIVDRPTYAKQWHPGTAGQVRPARPDPRSQSYNAIRKAGRQNPFLMPSGPDLLLPVRQGQRPKTSKGRVGLGRPRQAHRLRNVYKTNNVIAKTLQRGNGARPFPSAAQPTPLQNSLETLAWSSIIDDRVFGDLDSFRAQFCSMAAINLRCIARTAVRRPAKRTLRKQVQPYVSSTARKAIVRSSPFRRGTGTLPPRRRIPAPPQPQALPPKSQRQLVSARPVKLLASSTPRHRGALETINVCRRARHIARGRPDGRALDELRIAG